MTLEQGYLLDYLEEQDEAAIHGIAGTGKTVLAVQKAQRCAEHDPVLFLCFNRFLKEYLEIAYGNSNANLSFYTLDGLYMAKTHCGISVDPEERNNSILAFLLDWQQHNWTYKHIIVDEGQDFNNDHLMALHEIASAMGGCFYVFYDKNQFVQGKSYPDWLDKMECRLVLSRNCRNTREIAVTSTRPLGISEDKIKMRRDDPSEMYAAPPKPNLFFVNDKEELKEYIMKLLKKYTSAGYKRENIVVLSMESTGNSCLKKEDYQLAPAYFLSDVGKEHRILFTTVRKFKGLEADVVICIDVKADTFRDETQRSLFYVGTSRATTYLDIITLDSMENIACALADDSIHSRSQCIKVIKERLKVKVATKTDLTQ
jgi:hypothetical protein